MAATTYNVKTVTVGNTTITGVSSVTFNERQVVLGPGITADNDTYETFADVVGKAYSFTVTTLNPAMAKNVRGAGGALTLTFEGGGSGNDFRIKSAANAKQAGDITFGQNHRGQHTATINFILFAASGSVDPVT